MSLIWDSIHTVIFIYEINKTELAISVSYNQPLWHQFKIGVFLLKHSMKFLQLCAGLDDFQGTHFIMFTSKGHSRQLSLFSKILLEKPAVAQSLKKFTAIYRRFITLLTSSSLVSVLSKINPAHIPCPLSLRFILILSSFECLGLFPSGFPTETLYAPLSHAFYISYPSHLYLVRSTSYEGLPLMSEIKFHSHTQLQAKLYLCIF